MTTLDRIRLTDLVVWHLHGGRFVARSAHLLCTLRCQLCTSSLPRYRSCTQCYRQHRLRCRSCIYHVAGHLDCITGHVYRATGHLDCITGHVYRATSHLNYIACHLYRIISRLDYAACHVYRATGHLDNVAGYAITLAVMCSMLTADYCLTRLLSCILASTLLQMKYLTVFKFPSLNPPVPLSVLT
jgi:hypothetical protein